MKVVHSCCSAAGVFIVLADGSMWWRLHRWLGDVWQPIAPPTTPGRAATRRGSSVATARVQLARRPRRR